MRIVRLGSIGILYTILGTGLLGAADFSDYRGFQFGMNLAAAEKQGGMQPSDVKTVHQRPALIQELEWQPRFGGSTDPLKGDPVKEGLLSFLDGSLFRIVVTYDRYKVEGLTTDDMIAAISTTYGPATKPGGEIAYRSYYGDTAAVLARWEDADYSYNLVRTGDRASFALILFSKKLDALAGTAIAEAVRLDAQEAPQREIDKQKKQAAEDQLVLDKARSANKPNFRP
jgi:hypothetical protein